MIIVTAATGHLGRLVIDELLKMVPATEIAVAVRNPAKAAGFAARGIDVRLADYDRPETLRDAFRGATKVLLISASEIGKRVTQHRNAIDAIKQSGARLLVYTSILNADRSGIGLAKEHLATEQLIRASGVPFVFLRNSWYIENYTENLGPALQHGAIIGSADGGRVAAASRADFAAAAAAVLAGDGHDGKTYELAGDSAFTLAELAGEVSRAAGKTVVYKDMPAADHAAALETAGLPAAVAEMLADADQGIRRGDLDNRSGDLRRLIGHPTTPLADAVRAANH